MIPPITLGKGAQTISLPVLDKAMDSPPPQRGRSGTLWESASSFFKKQSPHDSSSPTILPKIERQPASPPPIDKKISDITASITSLTISPNEPRDAEFKRKLSQLVLQTAEWNYRYELFENIKKDIEKNGGEIDNSTRSRLLKYGSEIARDIMRRAKSSKELSPNNDVTVVLASSSHKSSGKYTPFVGSDTQNAPQVFDKEQIDASPYILKDRERGIILEMFLDKAATFLTIDRILGTITIQGMIETILKGVKVASEFLVVQELVNRLSFAEKALDQVQSPIIETCFHDLSEKSSSLGISVVHYLVRLYPNDKQAILRKYGEAVALTIIAKAKGAFARILASFLERIDEILPIDLEAAIVIIDSMIDKTNDSDWEQILSAYCHVCTQFIITHSHRSHEKSLELFATMGSRLLLTNFDRYFPFVGTIQKALGKEIPEIAPSLSKVQASMSGLITPKTSIENYFSMLSTEPPKFMFILLSSIFKTFPDRSKELGALYATALCDRIIALADVWPSEVWRVFSSQASSLLALNREFGEEIIANTLSNLLAHSFDAALFKNIVDIKKLVQADVLSDLHVPGCFKEVACRSPELVMTVMHTLSTTLSKPIPPVQLNDLSLMETTYGESVARQIEQNAGGSIRGMKEIFARKVTEIFVYYPESAQYVVPSIQAFFTTTYSSEEEFLTSLHTMKSLIISAVGLSQRASVSFIGLSMQSSSEALSVLSSIEAVHPTLLIKTQELIEKGSWKEGQDFFHIRTATSEIAKGGRNKQAEALFLSLASTFSPFALKALLSFQTTNPAFFEDLRTSIRTSEWKRGIDLIDLIEDASSSVLDEKTTIALARHAKHFRTLGERESVHSVLKPPLESLVVSRVYDLTTLFERSHIEHHTAAWWDAILDMISTVGVSAKVVQPVRTLVYSMLEYCKRERLLSPSDRPSMEFMYKNRKAIEQTITLGTLALEKKELHIIFQRELSVIQWLQSTEILKSGPPETFHFQAPQEVLDVEKFIKKMAGECQNPTDKALLKKWLRALRRPQEALSYFEECNASFVVKSQTEAVGDTVWLESYRSKDTKPPLALCRFLEGIWQKVPKKKRTDEMARAIGSACLACTEEFSPSGVFAAWIHCVSDHSLEVVPADDPQGEYEYRVESEKLNPQFCVTPEGICSVECTRMDKLVRSTQESTILIPYIRSLNRAQVLESNPDEIVYTFHTLPPEASNQQAIVQSQMSEVDVRNIELLQKYGKSLVREIDKSSTDNEILKTIVPKIIQFQIADPTSWSTIVDAIKEELRTKSKNADIATMLNFVSKLVTLGLSDNEDDIKLFIDRSKNAWLESFVVLDHMRRIVPESFQKIRQATHTIEMSELGAWGEGEAYFQLHDAVTFLEQNLGSQLLDPSILSTISTYPDLATSVLGQAVKTYFSLTTMIARFSNRTIHEDEDVLRDVSADLHGLNSPVFMRIFEQLAKAMLDYCDAERKDHPYKPSVRFCSESLLAIRAVWEITERHLGPEHLSYLIDSRPDLRGWLESYALVAPGQPDVYRKRLPLPKAGVDDWIETECTRASLTGPQRELVVSWCKHFIVPQKFHLDFLRLGVGSHFLSPTGEKIFLPDHPEESIVLTMCTFAQTIYNSFHAESASLETQSAIKSAIGKICLASTQEYFSTNVVINWILALPLGGMKQGYWPRRPQRAPTIFGIGPDKRSVFVEHWDLYPLDSTDHDSETICSFQLHSKEEAFIGQPDVTMTFQVLPPETFYPRMPNKKL